MKAAFVFSGQGAQFVGMAKDIAESSSAAATIFKEADNTLDWSVSDVCFNGPEEKLTESRYCQPAIYTVSCACLAAFKENYPNVDASANAGLSLGEFAALYSSGVFTFSEGLKLVAKRGELMDAACKETDGGMASVLGGDLDIISKTCEESDIDVANYNCPGQVVISGIKSGVKQAIGSLKEQGIRKVIPLKVAGAYHSRLMKSAGDKLEAVLADVEMVDPATPVAQNYTGGFVTSADKIKKNLVCQVAGSVRWDKCISEMIKAGADTVIEFGPGAVLTGLMRRIDRSIPCFNIGTAEQLDGFSE